jgi:uridine phosphorylase
VATFQKDAYPRLLERAGVDAKNSADRTIGEVDGVWIVEMEAAAIFAVARVRGVRAALIVAVSYELFGHERNVEFGHDAYLDSLARAADAAMDAAQSFPPA